MPKETVTLTRDLFDEMLQAAADKEYNRVINKLLELNAIRRDALGYLVAFNTYGTKVIYLEGLERE
jgi:hypothetical protein